MSSEGQLKAPSHGTWAAIAAVGLMLVACSAPGASIAPSGAGQYPGWPGSGTVVANGDFIPVLVSAEVGTGHSRLLITLQDAAGRTLAAPEVTVDEGFYDLAASTDTPAGQTAGTFRWLIPDS
jgi:hypothetical protein